MDSHRVVLICSPHSLSGAGLARILEEAGYRVPAAVSDLELARAAARSENPDLILLDSVLLREQMDSVGNLLRSYKAAVLVGPEKDPPLREAMAAGARGFLSVNVDPAQFLESVNLLIGGATVISAEPGRLMVDTAKAVRQGRPKQALSDQDRELALLVAEGASNREIAGALAISEPAVKVRLSQVLARLGLKNRQQLAVHAAEQGLLEDIVLREQPTKP
jgi:DNA-binding NarL/FixJ family response regulator